MRDWTNRTTEEILKSIFLHGYSQGYQDRPIKMDDDEYYKSLLAEIQKRIDNSFNNGYTVGYGTGYDKGYVDGYDDGFH